MLSLLLYGGGFILVWMTGAIATHNTIAAIFALGMLALAQASYVPTASAFVIDLAPKSLRGIYLSINSQCWAIGYSIGPLLGGWVLDRSQTFAHGFWLAAAASISFGILILHYLKRILSHRPTFPR